VERQRARLSLSQIADGEWATATGDPMISPPGYGVAATPWRTVPIAAGAVPR
jgi:hypothetical protein